MIYTVADKSMIRCATPTTKWRMGSWFPCLCAYTVSLGYVFCGRGFAGLHIPGIPVYVGELLLAMAIVYFAPSLYRGMSTRFQAWTAFLLLGFTVLFVKDVISSRHPFYDIIRDYATVYYVLFLVLYSGAYGQTFFKAIVSVLSKYDVVIAFSLLAHVVLGPFLATFMIIGGDSYGLFFTPGCVIPPFAALLIVLSVETELWHRVSLRKQIVVGVCAVAIILCQSRGGIVGALTALGCYILCLTKPRMRCVSRILMATSLAVLLALPFVATVSRVHANLLAGVEQHEFHVFSSETVVAKFRALIDPDGEGYKGATGRGRITWWQAVLVDTTSSVPTMLCGQGFGQNLGEVINYRNEGTRGAHNAWVNMFGWAGLMGVGLYASIYASVCTMLTCALKYMPATEGCEGSLACKTSLVFLIAVCVTTMFDNSLSSPVTAIPLYMYLGASIATVRTVMRARVCG